MTKVNYWYINWFFQIPCRCILKTYREWIYIYIYIHKIIVPFKDNKDLNKRWDIRNHPFYLQFLNGSLYPKENVSSKGTDINLDFENQIKEGK